MAKTPPAELRNVALAGHAGSGKTILADAILLRGKAIGRLGSIADGTTAGDYEKEEKQYGYSLSAAVTHARVAGAEINLIDTPGQSEFQGGMISGLAAGDLAVICVNAARGVELVTRKAWEYAEGYGLARFVALTRADAENVNLAEAVAQVRKAFGSRVVPFVRTEGEGPSLAAVRAILADPAAEGGAGPRQAIIDGALEADEALMEKYLESGSLDDGELAALLPKAVRSGALVPLFVLSAEKDLGVAELIDAVVRYAPSPLDVRPAVAPPGQPGDRQTVEPSADGPFLARVFKVTSDAHVGKLCYLRVLNGRLEAKGQAILSSTGRPERVNQLLRPQGDRREETPEACVGDIVVAPKVENLRLGDTLHGSDPRIPPPLPLPSPMCGLAVSPKARGDEQKLGTNMHRLADEDATFAFTRDEHTGEQLIRGMGMVHLDVMLARLKSRYGLEVNTAPPKIPYLETVTRPAEGSYRHKKQTGGSGQFAEVHLRLKPAERGKGFEFVDAIVGGVISGPFIPSVEKGVRKGMERGPVAGFPVVDLTVELFFGKEHPVDSKDIAFQIAGEMGFKEIVAQAKPVLLEPIANMEIVFPGRYFGDISGDISGRRGRPTGTDQLGDMQVLKAQVPLAEVADYSSTIKAITQGEGFFSMALSHYEPVPGNIASHVVAKLREQSEAK